MLPLYQSGSALSSDDSILLKVHRVYSKSGDRVFSVYSPKYVTVCQLICSLHQYSPDTTIQTLYFVLLLTRSVSVHVCVYKTSAYNVLA